MKPGIPLHALTHILSDLSQKEGWALCVGAGISLPAFPSWLKLVEKLMARELGEPEAAQLAPKLLRTYNADALIQAARNRLPYTEQQFQEILADDLYSTLRETLTPEQYQRYCNVLASARPYGATKQLWKEFLSLTRKHFPGMSALQIADVLVELAETPLAPSAVISFNAEPLLLSLVNGLFFEKFADGPSTTPQAGDLRQVFDYVTHSVSRRRAGRIPYVFCHGLLPVPDPAGSQKRRNAVDKLVFSETSYLQLANSAFSWQSSVFLNASSSQHLVFVGVSLSDPNMRRWLSWAHDNRCRELQGQYGSSEGSTAHYWITKHPGTTEEAQWVEAAVSHLGVRLVWLPEWDKVGEAFRRLLYPADR